MFILIFIATGQADECQESCTLFAEYLVVIGILTFHV